MTKTSSGAPGFARRHPILLATLAALALLVLLFDWNWLRSPLERYIAHKTQREFRISHLDVRLGLTPTIQVRDLYFGNPPWAREKAMAKIDALEFSVSLRDLPDTILVPRVALTRPELHFERLADGRRNWVLAAPDETQQPSRLRIQTLSVDHGALRYRDETMPLELDLKADTLDPAPAPEAAQGKEGPAPDSRYGMRHAFSGKYRGADFSGQALSGEVLSLLESKRPFPIQTKLQMGSTRIEAEGSIADVTRLSALDARLRIEGRTLSNLYPFLPLPLPTSPPYRLEGHLVLDGNRYAMDELRGRIGSTDISGKAAYLKRQPRPLLTADLHSKLLDMADLGPLIGAQEKKAPGKSPAAAGGPKKGERPAPQQTAQAGGASPRLLPAGRFDGSRLQMMDAEVDLVAARLHSGVALPLENLRASLRLHDAILQLAPLNFGFAGGTIASEVRIDAREPTLRSQVRINLQGVRLAEILPEKKQLAEGAGLIGATLQLSGSGNSIAEASTRADGHLSATVTRGRISNLLDAVSGLNGGKVLRLLTFGDHSIAVQCGAAAFDVKNGRGSAKLFVIDTEQTQILGSGWFEFGPEQFELMVRPLPKKPGVLSLRSPLRMHGSFRQPQYEIVKGPLLARTGAAIALGAVAPWAALLPLTETGPGKDTDCAAVQKQVADATRQAQKTR